MKVEARTFLRSLLIQGSWNYRTVLGTGFAFALLPALRETHGHDRTRLRAAVRRHLEYFNANPYLAGIALGGVIRLEREHAEPSEIRRFREVSGSALGGIGDSLVWGGLLPASSLLALVLWLTGAPSWAILVSFLGTYNAGHLALRRWALRTGLRAGREVAAELARTDLGRWIKRLRDTSAALCGLALGSALVAAAGIRGGVADLPAVPSTDWPWAVLAVGGLVAGAVVGRRAWRPAATFVVGSVVACLVWGIVA